MRMKLAIAAMMMSCRATPSNTSPIEYVGGNDQRPGIADAQPPGVEYTADGRQLIRGSDVLWCFDNPDGTRDGECGDTEAQCRTLYLKRYNNAFLDGWSKAKKDNPAIDDAAARRIGILFANERWTQCQETPVAACFWATIILTGKDDRLCSPRIVSCDRLLDEVRGNADFHTTWMRCAVYRAMR